MLAYFEDHMCIEFMALIRCARIRGPEEAPGLQQQPMQMRIREESIRMPFFTYFMPVRSASCIENTLHCCAVCVRLSIKWGSHRDAVLPLEWPDLLHAWQGAVVADQRRAQLPIKMEAAQKQSAASPARAMRMVICLDAKNGLNYELRLSEADASRA
jgi:hypothetical protein